MANNGKAPESPPPSENYNQGKNISFSLNDQELEKLNNEIQIEMDMRHKEAEYKKSLEETAAEFAAWEEKRLARIARKWEERHDRKQWRMYGSATESESENSERGYEYYVEEVETSETYSHANEEKKRLGKYYEKKLYVRTMHEGETTEEEENELLEDETDEEIGKSEGRTEESSDFEYGSPVPSGSDYNNGYEEEDWESYNEED